MKLSTYFIKGKLQILIYHRVHQSTDIMFPEEVTAAIFDWQMQLVSKYFCVIPLDEAICKLQTNELPVGALCITFDDGYADNATVALPILKKYNLSATFFVATGYLNGGRMWNDTVIESVRNLPNGRIDLTPLNLGIFDLDSINDRQNCAAKIIQTIKHMPSDMREMISCSLSRYSLKPLPDDLMMNNAHLRMIVEEGMHIGGHTVSHPILTSLNVSEARNEILSGKNELENILNVPVKLFAYPNGKPVSDYDDEHVKIVKELGFLGAVSTEWGVSTKNTDTFQLRRFTPWDKNHLKFKLRLIKNYLND